MNAPKVKPWAVVMTQKEADALTARVAELEATLRLYATSGAGGGPARAALKGKA